MDSILKSLFHSDSKSILSGPHFHPTGSIEHYHSQVRDTVLQYGDFLYYYDSQNGRVFRTNLSSLSKPSHELVREVKNYKTKLTDEERVWGVLIPQVTERDANSLRKGIYNSNIVEHEGHKKINEELDKAKKLPSEASGWQDMNENDDGGGKGDGGDGQEKSNENEDLIPQCPDLGARLVFFRKFFHYYVFGFSYFGYLYNIKTQKYVIVPFYGFEDWGDCEITAMSISNDKRFLYCSGQTPYLFIYEIIRDPNSDDEKLRLFYSYFTEYSANCVSVSPDGRFLALARDFVGMIMFKSNPNSGTVELFWKQKESSGSMDFTDFSCDSRLCLGVGLSVIVIVNTANGVERQFSIGSYHGLAKWSPKNPNLCCFVSKYDIDLALVEMAFSFDNKAEETRIYELELVDEHKKFSFDSLISCPENNNDGLPQSEEQYESERGINLSDFSPKGISWNKTGSRIYFGVKHALKLSSDCGIIEYQLSPDLHQDFSSMRSKMFQNVKYIDCRITSYW